MKRFFRITFFFVTILFLFINNAPFAQRPPLEYLKYQEKINKDSRGVIHLGSVMTVNYRPNSISVDTVYYPLLLEVTDVLKIPSRKNYNIVLKGYTDSSGSPEINLSLSKERTETLKRLLVEKYYMKPERIKTKGFGNTNQVASNETAEGRKLNRRVEIHIYGDVSESVKFYNKLEGIK